jgi:[acyl-carrier-protein] S-malonyltransferase
MKLAWLFPGQGAQKVGMGKDVFEASAAARTIYELANAEVGFALSSLCFDGPEADLTLTANTQPAILTTSCALLAALREAYPDLPEPTFGAGHSLGEYSALVAAGALSFEDAVRLVRLRGQAMQAAVPPGQGGMVALLGGDHDAVNALCEAARGDQVLSPANFNCPGQVVIAGHAEATQRATELAKDFKLKAMPLKVSAPFHCALMAPAATEVRAALQHVDMRAMNFPVVANVSAEPNDDPGAVPELLVRQIDGAVRWEQTINWLAARGVTHALEIGPGRVLAGLVKKTAKTLAVHSVFDSESLRGVPEFLQS